MYVRLSVFNSFPDDKLSAYEDEFSVPHVVQSIFDRIENIVGKGKNAGYLHFLLFLQDFPNASFQLVVVKSRHFVVKF